MITMFNIMNNVMDIIYCHYGLDWYV